MDYTPGEFDDIQLDPAQSFDDNAAAELFAKEEEERQRKLAEAAAFKKQQEAQAAEATAKQNKEQSIGGKVQSALQGGIEAPTAIVGGFIDAAEQVGAKYNQPWMEVPDEWEPQNKTPWGTALRNFVTAAGPAIGLALLTRKGVSSLGAKAGLVNPPKWVEIAGNAGIDAASGLAWDSVGRHAEDENLMGMLKKNLGGAFGWIPDDLATLDTDSPDIKRRKNQVEGVGLGLLVDALQGGVALARAIKGAMPGVEFVAKDAQAAKNLQEITNKGTTNFSAHPTLDRIIRNGELREAAVDEMAVTRANKNGIDQLDPFVHSPLFDESEKLPKAVQADGLMQAMVDNKRIQDNLGTVNGRMASFMSDAAIDGLEMSDLAGRSLVKKIEDAIKRTGNFEAKLPDGKMLGLKEILKAGDNLAAVILDPRMSGDELKRMFDAFDLKDTKAMGDNLKLGYINDQAYAGAMKSIKELKDYYLNIDTARASAYLQTSLAGEVSDIADGVRVMGDAQDVTRAQDLILDKLKVLWYESDMASSIAGWSLNNKKVWENVVKSGDANAARRFAKEAKDSIESSVMTKAAKHAQFLDTLSSINKQNPQYAKALNLAYAHTDGKVDSINKLNTYMSNTLGIWNKAFLDGSPEIPSQVVQSMFGLLYNAKLSSLLTPVKALANNFALLLMKPANVMLGAALRGDAKTMHRAWVQYATHVDTTFKASMSYMGDVFKKVAADPTITQRTDFVTRDMEAFVVAKNYAQAKGDWWTLGKVGFVEMMNDFNAHPWVRYSMNMMEGGDGFVKATVGMAEARGRAYDQLLEQGKKITGDDIERISKEIYDGMFDNSGMITDDAVKYFSDEISMKLDSPLSNSFNEMLNRTPALKTIFLFPRTSTNILGFVGQNSPLSIFWGDVQKIRALKDPDEIAEFMGSKGLKFTEANWNHYKSEALGRVAMGTGLMTYGMGMWVSGNLTGNGNYDRQTTKFQQNVGQKPLRSWRGPDGKWRSYDGIEPVATLLALTADIFENYNTLGTGNAEALLTKAMYGVSMNLMNKSFLTGFQPLSDMAAGNEAAINRWTSNLASVGIFSQVARLMMPGLREVDMDMQSMLRNKYNILDAAGVGKPLPYKVDFIDGGIVGSSDPVTNFFNSFLPFKTSGNPSPEKEFLIESEYDFTPGLAKSIYGAKYTAEQRTRLAEIIYKQGHLKKGLTKLMNDPRSKEDLANTAEMRSRGVDSKQADLSNSWTHRKLRELFNQTTNLAKRELAQQIPEIRKEELKLKKTKQAQADRDLQEVLTLNNR